MVASVPGCLTWPIAADAHWSGPSLWYACVLLAVTSVFLASQQALVLRDLEMDKKLENDDYVESIRQHFLSWIVDERKPEPVVTKLFVWQAPIMFLGFSVFCFLGGLCSVIFSPLARTLEWAPQAKVCLSALIGAANANVLCSDCRHVLVCSHTQRGDVHADIGLRTSVEWQGRSS